MDTDSWFSPPLRWPPTAWYRTTERSESHARPIWSRTPDVQPAKACVPRLAQTWSLSQKITLIWMIKIMNSLRTYFFFSRKPVWLIRSGLRMTPKLNWKLQIIDCQIIKRTGWWCQPLWKSSGERWSSHSYGFFKMLKIESYLKPPTTYSSYWLPSHQLNFWATLQPAVRTWKLENPPFV